MESQDAFKIGDKVIQFDQFGFEVKRKDGSLLIREVIEDKLRIASFTGIAHKKFCDIDYVSLSQVLKNAKDFVQVELKDKK